MDNPEWYEDLDDYTERVSNMSEEELDKELENLAQRMSTLTHKRNHQIKKGGIFAPVYLEKRDNVHED